MKFPVQGVARLRDHYIELSALGANIFGLSIQNSEYQKEMLERLHLPFLVLSDLFGNL